MAKPLPAVAQSTLLLVSLLAQCVCAPVLISLCLMQDDIRDKLAEVYKEVWRLRARAHTHTHARTHVPSPPSPSVSFSFSLFLLLSLFLSLSFSLSFSLSLAEFPSFYV